MIMCGAVVGGVGSGGYLGFSVEELPNTGHRSESSVSTTRAANKYTEGNKHLMGSGTVTGTK